jgi:hypothetical protein
MCRQEWIVRQQGKMRLTQQLPAQSIPKTLELDEISRKVPPARLLCSVLLGRQLKATYIVRIGRRILRGRSGTNSQSRWIWGILHGNSSCLAMRTKRVVKRIRGSWGLPVGYM